MLPTQNQNALQFAQEIVDFTNAFDALLDLAQSIASKQLTHGYAANLQAMPTYTPDAAGNPPLADGTGAIVPDAAPSQANPIIAFGQTFFNLDQARILLSVDFISFATGTSQPAQLDRRPKVAAIQP